MTDVKSSWIPPKIIKIIAKSDAEKYVFGNKAITT